MAVIPVGALEAYGSCQDSAGTGRDGAGAAKLSPGPSRRTRALFWSTATGGRMRRLVTTITLLLGAAVLAGCQASVHIGGSRTIDTASMEDKITTRLQDNYPGLHVDSVACPKDVKPAEGAAFQCTAKFDGAQAPFTVTLSNVNASTGGFDYQIKQTKAILIIDKAVKLVKSTMQELAPNATVDCGTARWQVVEVGGALECTISEGSERVTVRLVVKNVDGTVHIETQS
jgi:Domain of unknown function (DUF4333)